MSRKLSRSQVNHALQATIYVRTLPNGKREGGGKPGKPFTHPHHGYGCAVRFPSQRDDEPSQFYIINHATTRAVHVGNIPPKKPKLPGIKRPLFAWVRVR